MNKMDKLQLPIKPLLSLDDQGLGLGLDLERLQQCVEEIHRWCASRRLQLNPAKTEVIWFGTAANLRKIKSMDLALHVGSDDIKPVNVVRDLGVILDQELSMKQHINKVTSNCFFQIRRLKQVRRILGPEITTSLITAFVTSRLDYCNFQSRQLPRFSGSRMLQPVS